MTWIAAVVVAVIATYAQYKASKSAKDAANQVAKFFFPPSDWMTAEERALFAPATSEYGQLFAKDEYGEYKMQTPLADQFRAYTEQITKGLDPGVWQRTTAAVASSARLADETEARNAALSGLHYANLGESDRSLWTNQADAEAALAELDQRTRLNNLQLLPWLMSRQTEAEQQALEATAMKQGYKYLGKAINPWADALATGAATFASMYGGGDGQAAQGKKYDIPTSGGYGERSTGAGGYQYPGTEGGIRFRDDVDPDFGGGGGTSIAGASGSAGPSLSAMSGEPGTDATVDFYESYAGGTPTSKKQNQAEWWRTSNPYHYTERP